MELNVNKAPDGSRIGVANFQGVALTVTGTEKKTVKRSLHLALIALFKQMDHSTAVCNVTAEQYASRHGLSFEDISISKNTDGSRIGTSKFQGITVEVNAAHKKEVKQKLQTALLALFRSAADTDAASSRKRSCGDIEQSLTKEERKAAKKQKKDTEESQAEPVASGTNWAKVSLGDQSKTSKFMALMGATKAKAEDSRKTENKGEEEAKGGTEKKKKNKEKKEKEKECKQEEPLGVPVGLHQKMSSFFVPPSSGHYHSIPVVQTKGGKKYSIVMPGEAAPHENVYDDETRQKIAAEQLKQFGRARKKANAQAEAGLGFAEFTHEQFSQNEKLQNKKITFD